MIPDPAERTLLPPPPPPPMPPPRQRRVRPWLLVVLGVVLLLGVGAVLARNIELDYYSISPGPVEDVGDFVTVAAGAETYEAKGDLVFLTVLLDEVTVLEYIDATLDRTVDLQQQESIRPAGVSREELAENNRRSMSESKQRAIFVALTELGYDATLTGEGALVVGLVEDGPAVGHLEDNDVITAVDGEPVQLSSEVVAAVADKDPGDRVVLRVDRPIEGSDEVEKVTVDVTLGVHPDDDSRGFIGIFVDTANLDAEFPVEVEIDSRNIGGPSAGMMYTLGIFNLLTPDDITKGYLIAGTGTIEFSGDVGPIGGVRQKVYTARDAGADFVLVPRSNYDDAMTASGSDIEVVPIETFADALAFLDALPPSAAVAAG